MLGVLGGKLSLELVLVLFVLRHRCFLGCELGSVRSLMLFSLGGFGRQLGDLLFQLMLVSLVCGGR